MATNQTDDDAQTDDTHTYPTHGDGFWSDDKFRDSGRYDY
jgi:hypothetical protein